MGLDLLEVSMALEEEFNISVPDEQFGCCRTVGDLSRLVHELAPELDTRDVVKRVARIVANQCGMKSSKIAGGDRLLDDLGLG